jgi:hypothetical protein
MSMSPDDPSFLDNLQKSLGTNLNGNPLMGIAMGLLQAGGPSRMPTSFGQALGQGMQTGQQFQSQGIQQALQNIELQKAKTQLGFLNDMNQPNQALDPNDPTSDPTYRHWQRLAMAGIPGAAEAATQQLATVRSKERPATSQEVTKFFPQGVLPGQSVVIDGYGNPKILGESAIKTVQIPGPNGTMVTVPYDARTGKLKDVGGSLAPKDYTQPLNGAMEQQAQAVAQYRQLPPTVSSRYPGAADIRARANELIKESGGQGLDDTTFPSKMAATKSLTSGKDYQQNSAYSTIQTHMQTLDDAMSALDNGDIQNANKLTQWAGKQFGKAAPQNAKVVNDIVVGELAKVLGQGGQVTDAVRNEAAGMLEPYLSKGQYKGATDYIRQLIAGKMNTSFINAKASHIPEDVFMAHLTPEARQQLQIFRQEHPDNGTPSTAKTLTYDPATGTIK